MTLLNYSLLQRESSEDAPSYQVHPVVRGYVESKLGAEKMRGYHLRAVEFYVGQHEDYLLQFLELNNLTNVPRSEYPKRLAQIAKLATQQGHTQFAQTLTESLLEMHHHLFAAIEYERADDLVESLYPFLHLAGRREVVKALLSQSVASLEGLNKYVAKGNLATILNDEGKWQEALVTYQECFDYFASIDAKLQMTDVISQQAQIYQNRGEYEKALELEHQTMAVYEEAKNNRDIAATHYRIAQLLFLMNRYDEALVASEQVLAKVRAINYQYGIAKCLHQLGLALNQLNRPQEAFARFQESLEIQEKIGNRNEQADTLGAMGQLFQQGGDLKSALRYLHKAIEIVRELGNPIKLAIALEDYGHIFEQQGHFSEALEKYQEALRLAQQYSSPQHIAHIENHIARVKGKMKSQ